MGMDWTTDSEFGDKVAKLCIDKYSSLPRTGKPQADKEWTLLAGVVLCMAKEGGYSLEIVSLATGSKCIGKSKMSKTGEVLNDSHAEVLAKRAFLRYIYSQILELHKSGDSTVLQSTTGGRCRVKAGISFHMYTSHTPCGDASIFPKEDDVNYDNKNSESGIGTIVAGDESMPDSKRSFKAESSDLDQLIQKNTKDDTKINECSINRDKLSESCLDSKVKETHDKVHEKTEVYSETETCGTPAKTDIESLNEGRIKAKRKRESEDIRNADRLAKLCKTEEISDRCLDAISDKNQAHAEKLDKTEEEVARMTENKEEKASQLQGSDIYRTGAKCVNGGLQDPKGKGNNYHVTGAFSSSHALEKKKKVDNQMDPVAPTTNFVWASLKGVPVPWPVKITKFDQESLCALVFIKSDNAMLNVHIKDTKSFTGKDDILEQEAIDKLKKKNLVSTLECFRADARWAKSFLDNDSEVSWEKHILKGIKPNQTSLEENDSLELKEKDLDNYIEEDQEACIKPNQTALDENGSMVLKEKDLDNYIEEDQEACIKRNQTALDKNGSMVLKEKDLDNYIEEDQEACIKPNQTALHENGSMVLKEKDLDNYIEEDQEACINPNQTALDENASMVLKKKDLDSYIEEDQEACINPNQTALDENGSMVLKEKYLDNYIEEDQEACIKPNQTALDENGSMVLKEKDLDSYIEEDQEACIKPNQTALDKNGSMVLKEKDLDNYIEEDQEACIEPNQTALDKNGSMVLKEKDLDNYIEEDQEACINPNQTALDENASMVLKKKDLDSYIEEDQEACINPNKTALDENGSMVLKEKYLDNYIEEDQEACIKPNQTALDENGSMVLKEKDLDSYIEEDQEACIKPNQTALDKNGSMVLKEKDLDNYIEEDQEACIEPNQTALDKNGSMVLKEKDLDNYIEEDQEAYIKPNQTALDKNGSMVLKEKDLGNYMEEDQEACIKPNQTALDKNGSMVLKEKDLDNYIEEDQEAYINPNQMSRDENGSMVLKEKDLDNYIEEDQEAYINPNQMSRDENGSLLLSVNDFDFYIQEDKEACIKPNQTSSEENGSLVLKVKDLDNHIVEDQEASIRANQMSIEEDGGMVLKEKDLDNYIEEDPEACIQPNQMSRDENGSLLLSVNDFEIYIQEDKEACIKPNQTSSEENGSLVLTENYYRQKDHEACFKPNGTSIDVKGTLVPTEIDYSQKDKEAYINPNQMSIKANGSLLLSENDFEIYNQADKEACIKPNQTSIDENGSLLLSENDRQGGSYSCSTENDTDSDYVEDSEGEVTEIHANEDEPVLAEKYIVRDFNMPGIYIRKHRKSHRSSRAQSAKKKETNTRVYDNFHACLYCGKLRQHLKPHLNLHKNLLEVKELLKEENPNLTLIRKKGDHAHNVKVLKNGFGEIILSRRPPVLDIGKFGPCPMCKEWLLLKNLKGHYKKCAGKEKKGLTKRQLIVQSQVLSGVISLKPSKLMLQEVFPSMVVDNVGNAAKQDEMIIALGESWLRRSIDNHEKRRYYTSQHMRLMAKVLLELRKSCDEEDNSGRNLCNKPLSDFLRTEHFDRIVACTLKCCLPFLDDIEELQSPSNAIKIKYDLRRVVSAKWALLVKRNPHHPLVDEMQKLLELISLEWGERLIKLARSVMVRKSFTLKKELPTPEDVLKLTNHVVNELKTIELKKENYFRVVQIAQTRILMYNKRRSGEVDVISLESFAGKTKDVDELDQSMVNGLSKVELYLLKSQEMMCVRGKGNRPVPVLIPPDARKPLEFLASFTIRNEANIQPGNKYLFPNKASAYSRSYDALKKTCLECSLTAPARITSVSMRKYTATLTQMLNLDSYQVEWMCRHLGHTTNVHKSYYRHMSGFVERVHLSKLFLLQDMNLTSKFKGKNLEEIDLSELIFGKGTEEATEDEDSSEKENQDTMIKPGRGERTLSMSCSDKMASWNIVGCQGALLSHFLSAPIYFSSVTVGRCPYSHDAMQRALVSRSSSVEKLPTKFKLNTPKLLRSQIRFHHGKDVVMEESMKAGKEMKIVPCSSALAWTRIGYCSELLDVTTHGRKHGVTTKNLHKPQARSALCSKNLFDLFLSLIEDIQLQDRPSTLQNEELKTYKDFKMAAKAYQTAWQQLLEVYKAWEHKPEGYLDFT